jgi:hypothetical protein
MMLASACIMGAFGMIAFAQEEPQASAEGPVENVTTTKPVPKNILDPDLNPDAMHSVLFTFWEQTAINDARRARGLVRKPTAEELQKDLNQKHDDIRIKPPPEERDISLGGIVYVSDHDWTIWLNGKRITPDALPEEILDLRVHKEYIDMKWFDYYSNQIFPIRLRSHQRFNIDTRIFLPG